MILKIQAAFRGYMTRKRIQHVRAEEAFQLHFVGNAEKIKVLIDLYLSENCLIFHNLGD